MSLAQLRQGDQMLTNRPTECFDEGAG